MASSHTAVYQLNQWDAADPVIRTDFNEDNAKIEAALAQLQSEKASMETLLVVATEVGNVKKRLDALEGK